MDAINKIVKVAALEDTDAAVAEASSVAHASDCSSDQTCVGGVCDSVCGTSSGRSVTNFAAVGASVSIALLPISVPPMVFIEAGIADLSVLLMTTAIATSVSFPMAYAYQLR